MNLKEFCERVNVNYDDITNRFMKNEMLCLKFIKKFAEDGTYNELQDALKNEDYELIERSAHTLKGIAANLGFQKLFELSNQIVQDVRNNIYNNIFNLNNEIIIEYNKIISAISELE